MPQDHRRAITEIAAALRTDPSVLFITGAGVSADSGLPTYRGVGGLYDDADTDEGIPIEEALSGGMLHARPDIVWRHIHRIEAATRAARPNRAHDVIARFQQRLTRAIVLTQNVDGLHRAAGATDVLPIHGDLHDLSCTACSWSTRVDDFEHLEDVPRCPACGALVRPDVVLFGELLPPGVVGRLERELDVGFDLVFSVGTSSGFPYIQAPVWLTRRRGGRAVEVNPDVTPVSAACTWRLKTGAAGAFEALEAAYLDA